ncbi:MAG: hypothetical protein JWR07_473 [Nevskia sp.]|nr:hypothetical protein [Nevskia sp.]
MATITATTEMAEGTMAGVGTSQAFPVLSGGRLEILPQSLHFVYSL